MNGAPANHPMQQADMAMRSARMGQSPLAPGPGAAASAPVFASMNMVPVQKREPHDAGPMPGTFAGYGQSVVSPFSPVAPRTQPQMVYVDEYQPHTVPMKNESTASQQQRPERHVQPSVQPDRPNPAQHSAVPRMHQGQAPQPHTVQVAAPQRNSNEMSGVNLFSNQDSPHYASNNPVAANPMYPSNNGGMYYPQQVPQQVQQKLLNNGGMYYPQQVPQQVQQLGAKHPERPMPPMPPMPVQPDWTNPAQHSAVPRMHQGQAPQPHMVQVAAPQRNSNELSGVNLFSNQDSPHYAFNNPVAANPMYPSNNGGMPNYSSNNGGIPMYASNNGSMPMYSSNGGIPMYSSNGNGPQQLYASYDPRDLPQYALSQPGVATQSPPVYYNDALEVIAHQPEPQMLPTYQVVRNAPEPRVEKSPQSPRRQRKVEFEVDDTFFSEDELQLVRKAEAWEAQQARVAAQKNGKDDRENKDANIRDNTRENEGANKRAPAHSNVVRMKPVNHSEAVDIAICRFCHRKGPASKMGKSGTHHDTSCPRWTEGLGLASSPEFVPGDYKALAQRSPLSGDDGRASILKNSGDFQKHQDVKQPANNYRSKPDNCAIQ